MRPIILIVFLAFASLSVFAKAEIKKGVYKVEAIHSLVSMTPLMKPTRVEGTVEIRETFEESKFNFSHPADYLSFESQSVQGDLRTFKVKGNLMMNGVTRDIVLVLKHVGSVSNDQEKIGFQGQAAINPKDFDYPKPSKRLLLRFLVLASKPSMKTMTIFKEVGDLVE